MLSCKQSEEQYTDCKQLNQKTTYSLAFALLTFCCQTNDSAAKPLTLVSESRPHSSKRETATKDCCISRKINCRIKKHLLENSCMMVLKIKSFSMLLMSYFVCPASLIDLQGCSCTASIASRGKRSTATNLPARDTIAAIHQSPLCRMQRALDLVHKTWPKIQEHEIFVGIRKRPVRTKGPN